MRSQSLTLGGMQVGPISSAYKDKRVLIVGHSGFKGSWLALALHLGGAEVWGLSLDRPQDPRHAFHALRVNDWISNRDRQIGDVRSLETVLTAYEESRPDFVFHVAAQAVVSVGYRDPHTTFTTNSTGVINTLEAHRHLESDAPLVVVTSDKAYRNRESMTPYTESDEVFGDDPYSASKAMAEIAIHSYRFSYERFLKTGLASVRAGNVFGGGDWSANRLVPDCASSLEATGSVSLRMPDAVRPWTYVLDVLFGYLRLGQALATHPATFSRAWNFASGDTLTVREVAEVVARSWEPPGRVVVSSGSVGHETTHLLIDASDSRRELGWLPLFPLQRSLEETASWYLRQARGADMFALSVSEVDRYWREYDGHSDS